MDLKAELRTQTGTAAARRDRAAGKVPVTLYGKDVEATSLLVDRLEFDALLRHEGVNAVFNLSYDGKDQMVLIRDFEKAALSDIFYNVDLLAVSSDTKLELSVPLYLVNVEKVEEPGIVQTVMNEILIATTPASIPDSFEIDVAGMEIGDSVEASEIKMPEGVDLLIEADETVVTVTAPTDEPEEVDPDAEVAEPEVIGEDDEEEEEEEE